MTVCDWCDITGKCRILVSQLCKMHYMKQECKNTREVQNSTKDKL